MGKKKNNACYVSMDVYKTRNNIDSFFNKNCILNYDKNTFKVGNNSLIGTVHYQFTQNIL